MKTQLITIMAIAIVCVAHAEPVKFRDGTTKEAVSVRIIPAQVEYTTAMGKVAMPLKAFDTKWLDQRFPNPERNAMLAQIAALSADVEALGKETTASNTDAIKGVIDVAGKAAVIAEKNKELRKALAEMVEANKELIAENDKLEAELAAAKK